MTDETLNKARNIKAEINKTRDALNGISYREKNTERERRYLTAPEWMWKIRLFNDRSSGEEKARIILFDNNDPRGTDIEVTEEFLDYIKAYFENKLKVKEQEYQDLC